MINKLVLVAVVIGTTCSGCAAVNVDRVTASTEGIQRGVRYYRPAPYLALSQTEKGQCQGSLVMLPDYSQEYAITMTGGLWGTATANPTLQDGWNLTSLNGTVDTKTSELITAVGNSVPKLSPLFTNLVLPTTPVVAKRSDCSGFMKLRFDRASGALTGYDLRETPDVAVNVTAPANGGGGGNNSGGGGNDAPKPKKAP